MSKKKKLRYFHIDERFYKVNLTYMIVIYSVTVVFCFYLCLDNYIRGEMLVAKYALFCAVMTAIAVMNFSICKFGKKKRMWLTNVALQIQCFVYWITFVFFLYTGGTEGSSIFLFFLAVPMVFFFFNLFWGVYFNLVFFVIMAVYMNTPLRELGYKFPDVYYQRLPMMFLVNVIMCGIAQYEIVKANIRQDRALEEARKASEAKTDFLANTSHEIRTPINAVLGMNEMILRESAKAEKLSGASPMAYHEAFKKIRTYSGNVDSAGSNLLAIINDILDFTKIEEGKMDIVEVEYQLSSVINDVSNMIYFKAREKNLTFVTEVDENLPDHLFGDVVRVRQVITNILNNAVKYTDEGSVLLKVTGEKLTEVRDGKELMKLTVAVKDTGIGISEENIGKLFGKFERVDLEKNSTKEGTGLGLAITKMLLEMMDGNVSVQSKYGEGSTFTIIIPQVILSEEPIGNFKEKFEKSLGEKKAYHESFRAPNAKILIVDDTKMNLLVATEFLKDTQLMVDTAGGGKQAVELALKNKYDVILMDQRMPEMDGEEAFREIRSHKDGPNIDTPVICLTADAVVGARERYLSKGFNDYLTKPIDSTYLETMLRKYIPADKIEIVDNEDVSSSKENAPEETAESPFMILEDSGINTARGLANCGGDDEFYRSMLLEYLRGSEEKKSDLKKFLDAKDYSNYGILIHSLKSTSSMIGAEVPYKLALDLEAAAKSGDEGFVTDNHEKFISADDKVLGAVASVVSADDELEEFDLDENGVMEFSPDN
jgi:signal transduction histidine kinase/CheY-like chemotaxis protein/HPt (histidine-containing phosphotransfer) domain-containing protein